MTVKISILREELLQQLEAVQPGLSPRETVEQSSCFVFQGGRVITYNEDIACQHETSLDIEGAVQAAPLLSLLRRLKEEKLDFQEQAVGEAGHELVVHGKGRKSGVRLEKKIELPIQDIEQPEDWRELPSDFSEAIAVVHECAGKDTNQFVTTCVHIHPKWVEASDNFQLTRYKLKTGFKRPVLVRSSSIKHLVPLGMTEFAETETWVHFRNPAGLIFSCRRFIEYDFPDFSEVLKISGSPASLPRGLGEAALTAEIFSSENTDNNQVLVELRPGKMRVWSQGVSGWYQEVISKLKYEGSPIGFLIAPKLLAELTKRHNECEITPGQLKVNGGKFVFVTCLDQVQRKEGEAPGTKSKPSKKKREQAYDEEE